MREFDSFGDFAAHLLTLEAVQTLAVHKALDRAAERIEKDAKDSIGTYQDSAGPFAAWEALAPATVADRVRQGYAPDEPLLREGDLRDSISRGVDHMEAVVGSDSDVMVYQEIGTEHIPPRAVLGPAAVHNEERVARMVAEAQALAWLGVVAMPIGLPKLEQ
jgi:hypothetical protein